MFNVKKLLLVAGILCTCILVKTETVEAKIQNSKVLEVNRTLNTDLNGDGKKEKVKFVTYGEHPCTAKLYINGKKVFSVKNENATYAEAEIFDANPKDKYKEIYINICSDSDCFEYGYCGRYVKGKWKKYFTFAGKDVTSPRIEVMKVDGRAKKAKVEIEFFNLYAMQGIAIQTYNIDKNGRLKCSSNKILNTTNEWRKNLYRTTRNIDVKKTIGGEKTAFTMYAGTKYYVYKVKLKKSGGHEISHIYVKTTDGRSGWVKIPNVPFCEGGNDYDGWSADAYIWG